MSTDGDKLYKLKKYTQAIPFLEEQLQRQPRNIYLLFKLGRSYYETGNFKQAYKHFTKSYELKPDNVYTLTFLFKTLVKLENYEDALKISSEKLNIAPNDKFNLLDHLTILYKLKLSEELLRFCFKYSDSIGKNKILLDKTIWTFSRLKLINDGKRFLDKLAETYPESDYLYAQKIIMEFQSYNDKNKIIEDMTPILQIGKFRDNPYINIFIAETYKTLKNNEKAIDHYEIALKQKPDSLKILSGLGFLYFKIGQEEKSINYLKKLFSITLQKNAFDKLLNIYIKLKKVSEFIDFLKETHAVTQKNKLYGYIKKAQKYEN